MGRRGVEKGGGAIGGGGEGAGGLGEGGLGGGSQRNPPVCHAKQNPKACKAQSLNGVGI